MNIIVIIFVMIVFISLRDSMCRDDDCCFCEEAERLEEERLMRLKTLGMMYRMATRDMK
jgi:hypothetical protein